jgi:hypothetical protein
MLESLFSKDPDLLIPIIMSICGTLVAIIAIGAHQWRCVRQAEVEGALKQDMLSRGMSVQEIERVVQASSQKSSKATCLSDAQEDLLGKMVKNGRSTEEIERVIRAFRGEANSPQECPSGSPHAGG